MDIQIKRRPPGEQETCLEQYRKAIMPATSSMRIDRPQEEIEHEAAEVKEGRLPF